MSASFDKHVMIWDASTQTLVRQIKLSGGGVVCWKAVVSRDGVVAAGFGDLTLRLFELATGKELRCLEGADGIVASLEFSRDGKKLFTGNCGDNTVRLWNVATGDQLASGKTKKSATWYVALSPDARCAVSAAADKMLHVWDLVGGCREASALAGHASKINGLAFFSDGRRVVSGSSDKTARVWDVVAKKQLAVLGPHKKAVSGVSVSPDGKTIASCSLDGTLILWDVAKAAERARFHAPKAITSIAFAPDGRSVLAGCADNVLRLWSV